MDTIIVEGVRCFHERQSAPLRPITLLTGENSTGKTTFLAVVRLLWDICQGKLPLDFNEEPFILGAYDQIASYRGGRAGRAKGFMIGFDATTFSAPGENAPVPTRVRGFFAEKDARPVLVEWLLEAGAVRISIGYDPAEARRWVEVSTASHSVSVSSIPPFLRPYPIAELLGPLLFALSRQPGERHGLGRVEGSLPADAARDIQRATYNFFQSLGVRPQAFAPIRTRPKRTYDPMKDIPEPEGSHVPMMLANIFSSDREGWVRLRQSLDTFGKASGLFSDVKVRRMGKKESGPFQIQVKISGPAFNLMDVGYGVSQVLPIVVDSLRGGKRSTFLLQQPEVHLHPKAQAELGSFLAFLAKEHGKRFVIETHSDYLVDRVRMEVRAGKVLKPEDVALLYFERADGHVRIHALEIDATGNILNAPSGYRQFFLEEEKRLLGG